MLRNLTITNPDGIKLSVKEFHGDSGWHVLFLSGYGSDMSGTKARFLLEKVQEMKGSITLFDYRGCGGSEGSFLDTSLGGWYQDTCHIMQECCPPSVIIIGSSMGGWLGMKLSQQFSTQIAGMILLAPAPDFPDRLFLPTLSGEMLEDFQRTGVTAIAPDAPSLLISSRFCQEAKQHNLLDGGNPCIVNGPVRIIQGMLDRDVPWSHALLAEARVTSPDKACILLPEHDHRLSEPAALDRLHFELAAMVRSQK